MQHLDLLKYSITNLRSRKLRSYLTILGIVIGIAAIVTLISVAQGVNDFIMDQLGMLGGNWISIMPGSMKQRMSLGMMSAVSGKLTTNDGAALKSIPGVEDVMYELQIMRIPIQYKNETATVTGGGWNAVVFEFTSLLEVGEGRPYKDNERHVVVIGDTVANDIFKKKIEVNQIIKVGDTNFRVVGILKKSGGLASTTSGMIAMPLEDARELLGQQTTSNQVDEMAVMVSEGYDPEKVGEQIRLKLRQLHHVDEDNEDFTVMTPESISSIVGTITGTLELFLSGIAGIALLVGGIGIANTMFMSVMERTKEIGVLKAIGATDNIVLEMFLLEASIIGLVGGVLGLVLAGIATLVLNYFGVPTNISPELAIFGLFFSVIVGALAGFFPARRASQLMPVEALRYE
ncbi:MAG: ABC transporter permease [Candidatus Micrarchaeota archaeon]|nr:ABC transporter permease [Candidatus Micrarchaeota archaeon]